jgi:hypothetical protein
MALASDAALKNRQYDSDGRLHILRTRISKATVNPYYGREIPDADTLGLDPNRIYYLLRDPDELKKAASSFARVPLMFKHIPVSAENPNQEHVAGTIGSDVEFESPYLIADLSVWDVDAIAGIETDTVRELSSSYHYTADMTPGVFEGQTYDGVMRNISGNHVALVESGRAGSDVMAADSRLETDMKETKFGKAIYAILCAISPKLAKDAALKPLVIGATPKTFDAKALEPKLLAMDADMPGPPTLAAMAAAKDAAEPEEKKEEPVAKEPDDKTAKDCGFCGSKDGQAHADGCKTAADEKAASEKAAKDAEMKSAEEKEKKDAEDKRMKTAMDAFETKLRTELRESDEARRAVRPVVGDVLAQDSAEDIYGFALDQLKVERKDVKGVPAMRALFNLAVSASKQKAPARPAFDSSNDMKEKFPNAMREIRTL